MKKCLLFLFVLSFLFLHAQMAITANGDDCKEIFGGQCKTVCNSQTENDLGGIHCEGGVGLTVNTCCVPKTSPVQKVPCGASCVSAAQCPPECQACQEQVRGQGKVCRVAGTIAPAPAGGDTIDTAIGPINVKSPEGFVSSILTLAIGIGGGIAILLIIFGGFQVLTSSGNPEQVKAGKEMITSAIAGLLLIIFSVFILRIIGVEVLKIFE